MTDSAPAITAYWNAAAAAFDDEPDHGLRAPGTRDAWAGRLGDWIPPGPSDVLDIGCGTGSLSLLLAEAGHRVTGVDLAPEMVERARAKLDATGLPGRFMTGDAMAPPTGERRFDVALARHLLWTLPDPVAALREWAGRLRKGGRLVLVEGRWRESGQAGMPYAVGAESLPWSGGVGAEELADVVRPLVARLRVERLDGAGDDDLWGKRVDDERYAVIADV